MPIWAESTGGDVAGGDTNSAERYKAVELFRKIMKKAVKASG